MRKSQKSEQGTNKTTFGNDEMKNETVDEGCELCEYVRRSEFDILAEVQFNVGNNDDAFLEAVGLAAICDKHIVMFNRVTTAKNSARLLRFLIKKSLEGDLLREYPQGCPVCEQLDTIEHEEVERIASKPRDHSDGDFVCVEHLKKILDITTPENRERTLAMYAESLKGLLSQLQVLETQRYYRTEPKVKSSLWRSVEKLTGRK